MRNVLKHWEQNQMRANKTKVVKNLKIRDDLVELAAIMGRSVHYEFYLDDNLYS
jgi:hypothetical protein